MKYDPYSLTELIRNDDFIAWVLHPDVELEMQWNIFLLENPEKKSTVESAREYVILLRSKAIRCGEWWRKVYIPQIVKRKSFR
jgi:hypothetical protein